MLRNDLHALGYLSRGRALTGIWRRQVMTLGWISCQPEQWRHCAHNASRGTDKEQRVVSEVRGLDSVLNRAALLGPSPCPRPMPEPPGVTAHSEKASRVHARSQAWIPVLPRLFPPVDTDGMSDKTRTSTKDWPAGIPGL